MIDIGKILTRAWHILWNYKVLWLFGLLVVVMGGSAGPNGQISFNRGGSYNYDGGFQGTHTPGQLPAFLERTNQWFDTNAQPWFDANIAPWFATPENTVHAIIWMVVGLLVFILVVGLLTSLVRFPSEVAIIRMVDEYEQSGTKVGFREGWKMGWSRRAFRLWAIDLIISLPAFVYVLVLLSLGLALAANAINGAWSSWSVAGGTIVATAIWMVVLGILVALVSLFLGLLRPFFARKAVLDETGVGESFRQGWAMFKGNWQSAGLTWLVMVGLAIAFALASLLLVIALIPVIILTALAGLLVAALPALLAYWIASLFSIAPIAWIVAILVGMPFFLLVMSSPLLLINSWVYVFNSTVWTLAYREIKVLEGIAPAAAAPAKA